MVDTLHACSFKSFSLYVLFVSDADSSYPVEMLSKLFENSYWSYFGLVDLHPVLDCICESCLRICSSLCFELKISGEYVSGLKLGFN